MGKTVHYCTLQFKHLWQSYSSFYTALRLQSLKDVALLLSLLLFLPFLMLFAESTSETDLKLIKVSIVKRLYVFGNSLLYHTVLLWCAESLGLVVL